MRLKDKTAIIVGAGQSPGETLGNGRAVSLLFAREGAKVMAVDSRTEAAEETAALITREKGVAVPCTADVRREADMKAMLADAVRRWGRLDILHYNVGASLGAGDRGLSEITEEAFDAVTTINLRGFIMAVKHAIPVMRAQKSGVILSISSAAALAIPNATVAYKTSKAGMIAFTEQIARQNAEHGIRCNVILPGLMDTPMAVDTRVRVLGRSRADIAGERDARVPLRRKMGTAMDVAYAALFLASDEASFITGVTLPVDGGTVLRSND